MAAFTISEFGRSGHSVPGQVEVRHLLERQPALGRAPLAPLAVQLHLVDVVELPVVAEEVHSRYAGARLGAGPWIRKNQTPKTTQRHAYARGEDALQRATLLTVPGRAAHELPGVVDSLGARPS